MRKAFQKEKWGMKNYNVRSPAYAVAPMFAAFVQPAPTFAPPAPTFAPPAPIFAPTFAPAYVSAPPSRYPYYSYYYR